MHFDNKNERGDLFGHFYVAQSRNDGPGWFIFGRNVHVYGRHDGPASGKLYGEGRYVRLCGYHKFGPANKYNGDVRVGWGNRTLALRALAEILAANPGLNEEGQ